MEKHEDNNIKKKLKNNLYKILSNVNYFLRNSKTSNLSQEEITNIVFTNPICQNNNLNKIRNFVDMLNNIKETTHNKVIELQEESEMRQKKRNEIKDLNDFLNTNIKFIENQEKNNNLLPSPNEINNEPKNENEDDILIEDTEEIEKQNLLNKKREKENPKEQVQNIKRGKYINLLCYTCKRKLRTDNVSKFYGRLCQKCGDYNYSFRTMKLDLTGRIAIVTGGRVKIGFHIAKKLLSYGCKVITTSRFPNDALLRFKAEPDYDIWKNNLMIYPIDFRIFQSTVNFVNYIKNNFTHIDILINNAAQTIRRSTEYYEYLIPNEIKKLSQEDDNKIIKTDYIELKKQIADNCEKDKNIDINKEEKVENKPEKKEILNSLVSLMKKDNSENNEILPLSVITSQIKIMEEKEYPRIYVMGGDGQPYDFTKGKNSWNFELDEIPFQEFTEVQIINTWTPYYLCAKLKPMLNKSPFKDKYIINVTAFEGIFNCSKKTTHVHTNMAKAALNMLTRTCGKYFEKEGIYMTCVDTSWVSHMKEMNKIIDDETKENCESQMACVPWDELDGAMRVLHPIIEGIKNKKYFSGVLLKDYVVSNW